MIKKMLPSACSSGKLYSTLFLLMLSLSAAAQKDLKKLIDSSFSLAAQQYLQMQATVPPQVFPRSINPDGTLMTNTSDWWTSGFFPGSLWYLYEQTRNEK